MNGCATLAKPRFIITVLVVSGIMVAGISLLHRDIAPAMLMTKDQRQEEGDLIYSIQYIMVDTAC